MESHHFAAENKVIRIASTDVFRNYKGTLEALFMAQVVHRTTYLFISFTGKVIITAYTFNFTQN